MADLRVFLFALDEGHLLGAAAYGVRRAAAHARGHGHVVRLTLVLRGQDAPTAHWAERRLDAEWDVLHSASPDLAAARNLAHEHAGTGLVAFVDGHDLWCEHWLHAAARAALQEPAIWRPEVLITFASDVLAVEAYSVVPQPDTSEDAAVLLLEEPYLAGFLAPAALLRSQPWPSSDSERGWDKPDQWWSCNAAAANHRHGALPDTFHYRRVPWHIETTHPAPLPSGDCRIGPTPLSRRVVNC
jgi:hypothetical protein